MLPDRARWLAPLALLVVASCATPEVPPVVQRDPRSVTNAALDTTDAEQVSQYIRCIFQDRDGNMWFGTTNDGVARYDGRSLDYFNASNGFGSDWVNAITQDAHGDLWFGTRDGVVRYDGTRFIRYTTKDGLANDHVWCMLLARSGTLWCGTWEGVSRFDPAASPGASGGIFTPFPIPAADLSKHPYYEDPKKINAIVEDKAGNIWFATNGGGAFRYDGSQLRPFSEKEGLCNNFVTTMLVDHQGTVWFGTRFGGLCTFDGATFANKELSGENLGVLYQQPNGTLWTVVMYTGLCSHQPSATSGATFTCYTEKDGSGIRVPFSLLEDVRGQLWIGTGEGLYQYVGGAFTNVTKAQLLQLALR